MPRAPGISEHVRLFVAVPVPEGVKNRIREFQHELQRLLPEAAIRWTPPEQIHLTLRFFGNVGSEQLQELKKVVGTACSNVAAFRLQTSGLGVFPDKRRPRVIWVGVRDEGGELATLQRGIQTVTAHFGEKPHERPFSAHLTLGRIKDLRSREATTLREFIEGEKRALEEWRVEQIELFRSELGSAGAKHSVIATFSLA